jgi:hypothetical protein
MKDYDDYKDEYENDDDYYSPTDWGQEPGESDADYEERMQDQQDLLEHFL